VYPSEDRPDFIDAALQVIRRVAMLEIPPTERANVKLDSKPLQSIAAAREEKARARANAASKLVRLVFKL